LPKHIVTPSKFCSCYPWSSSGVHESESRIGAIIFHSWNYLLQADSSF